MSAAATAAIGRITPAKARRESKRARKARTEEILGRLKAEYPDSKCALTFRNPLELLVATILSAQCTDKRVNMVTPELFARCPTAADYAEIPSDELEEADPLDRLLPQQGQIAARHGGRRWWTSTAARCRPTCRRWSPCPGWPARPPTWCSATPSASTRASWSTPTSAASPTSLALTGEKDPVKIERDLMALVPQQLTGRSGRIC